MDITSAHPSPRFVVDHAVTKRDGVERAFQNFDRSRRVIGAADTGMYESYKTVHQFPRDEMHEAWGRPEGGWPSFLAPVRAFSRSVTT